MADIIPLEQLYLMTLAATFKSLALDTVLQDKSTNGLKDVGRLWLVAPQSTVPHAFVDFQFMDDEFRITVTTRNERTLDRVIKYGEGIDAYLGEVTRFFQAGRISDKRKAA
jgi:hypothetical protein